MPESSWPASRRSDNAMDAFYSNAGNGPGSTAPTRDRRPERDHCRSDQQEHQRRRDHSVAADPQQGCLRKLPASCSRTSRSMRRWATTSIWRTATCQGGAPNENYPREVMQLFSIGLGPAEPGWLDRAGRNNQPIPTYTQTDVQQMAKALTGWTYANATHTQRRRQRIATSRPDAAVPGAHVAGQRPSSADDTGGQTIAGSRRCDRHPHESSERRAIRRDAADSRARHEQSEPRVHQGRRR